MFIKAKTTIGVLVGPALALGLEACGKDVVERSASGGTVTGGAAASGADATGGTLAGGGTGTGGASVTLANPVFLGEGTWVQARSLGGAASLPTGEGNLFGIQGAFYILEDSVKGGVVLADGLNHSDLDADSGAAKDVEPSQFDSNTLMPCISGSTAQVFPAPDLGDPEGYSTYWGGGIGLNLNETGGDDSIQSPWNATAKHVVGLEFIVSGDVGGQDVRLKATVADDPSTSDLNEESDKNYCVSIKAQVGQGLARVDLEDIREDCWEPTASNNEAVDPTRLVALQWQIVTDTSTPHAVRNFCVEAVGVVVAP